MRTHIIGGLGLLVLGPLAVLVGSALELELDATVYSGVAVGAALALLGERSPAVRLGAFVAGLAAAWITYVVRAGYTPDTAGGRAAAMALLVVLCVAVALVSVDRLPLWAVLLGAGTFAGCYEAAYSVAPSEVLSTSTSTMTSVLLTVALGFLAGSVAGGTRRRDPQAAGAPRADEHPGFVAEGAR